MADINTLSELLYKDCPKTTSGEHLFITDIVIGKVRIKGKTENLYSNTYPVCIACGLIDTEIEEK